MLRLILLITGICSNQANVISLEKIATQKMVYLNKIWNKYLDTTNHHLLLGRVKHLKFTSLLSLFYSYINFHLRNNIKFVKLTENCLARKKYLVTKITGKLCDQDIELYPTKRQDIHPMPLLYRLRCYTYNHFIQIREKHFSFKLNEHFMLNLTFLKVDLELSYLCEAEYIGKGAILGGSISDRYCGRLPQMTYIFGRFSFLKMNILADRKPHRVELQNRGVTMLDFEVIIKRRIKQFLI